MLHYYISSNHFYRDKLGAVLLNKLLLQQNIFIGHNLKRVIKYFFHFNFESKSIENDELKSCIHFIINPFSEIEKYGFHHFPLLQLDDGNCIFSCDAIIKYLLPNEEPVELRDQVSSLS